MISKTATQRLNSNTKTELYGKTLLMNSTAIPETLIFKELELQSYRLLFPTNL